MVKIQTRLMIILTALFLVFTAVLGILFYTYSKDSIEQGVYAHLETTAHSRADHIKSFLEEQKEKIETAATHQELSIEELKTIADINDEFYELFVLDSKGKIIASSDESKIGLDRSNKDYFISAKEETYMGDIYFSETTGKNSFIVSTPHASGILAARIDLLVLNEITEDKTGLGEAGEIYLINKQGYMISPSRF